MAGRKQFDMDAALDAAMIQFWQDGYADTSLDDLCRVTGLNRSSIYSSLGDKDALFLHCLQRYAERYGTAYDAALAGAADEPLAAVRAFLAVTLARIADPAVPDGCLVAQSALSTPVLAAPLADRARQAIAGQRTRLAAALRAGGLADAMADAFAVHIAAVNQSLAVMSRSGADAADLRTIVGVSLDALALALGRA